MKTPEEWFDELSAFGPKTLFREDIAEIQRDAREGMVPVEAVKRLVPIARGHVCNNRHECVNCAELNNLRDKHPELFTT